MDWWRTAGAFRLLPRGHGRIPTGPRGMGKVDRAVARVPLLRQHFAPIPITFCIRNVFGGPHETPFCNARVINLNIPNSYKYTDTSDPPTERKRRREAVGVRAPLRRIWGS